MILIQTIRRLIDLHALGAEERESAQPNVA
jgi:hypothetical protein